MDELQDRCNIGEMRLELEAKADKQKALLSSVKFDSGDFEALDQLFNSEAFSSWKHVSELRAKAMEAPPFVSQATMNELSEIRLWDSDPGVPRPEWMAAVCNNREAFSNSAFAFRDGDAKHYYKFMFAKQSPYSIMFAPLEKSETYTPMFEVNHSTWEAQSLQSWGAEFGVDFSKHVPWHEVPQVVHDTL